MVNDIIMQLKKYQKFKIKNLNDVYKTKYPLVTFSKK